MINLYRWKESILPVAGRLLQILQTGDVALGLEQQGLVLRGVLLRKNLRGVRVLETVDFPLPEAQGAEHFFTSERGRRFIPRAHYAAIAFPTNLTLCRVADLKDESRSADRLPPGLQAKAVASRMRVHEGETGKKALVMLMYRSDLRRYRDMAGLPPGTHLLPRLLCLENAARRECGGASTIHSHEEGPVYRLIFKEGQLQELAISEGAADPPEEGERHQEVFPAAAIGAALAAFSAAAREGDFAAAAQRATSRMLRIRRASIKLTLLVAMLVLSLYGTLQGLRVRQERHLAALQLRQQEQVPFYHQRLRLQTELRMLQQRTARLDSLASGRTRLSGILLEIAEELPVLLSLTELSATRQDGGIWQCRLTGAGSDGAAVSQLLQRLEEKPGWSTVRLAELSGRAKQSYLSRKTSAHQRAQLFFEVSFDAR